MSDVDAGQVPDNAQNGPQNGPENDENHTDNVDGAEGDENAAEGQLDDESAEDTIRRLRKENAAARVKAKETEALARKVHAALVAATGKLVDPEALPYDAEHLTDAEKLSAAIETLTDAKPWLKARKVTGDAGQGPRGDGKAAAPTWSDLFA